MGERENCVHQLVFAISLVTNWNSSTTSRKTVVTIRITWREKLLNKKDLEILTEQVVGRWIDPEAKKDGISQWKVSVLVHVERGNAPGGGNTHVSILVHLFYISQIQG